MATATVAKNGDRVLKKIIAILMQITVSNTAKVGAAKIERARRRVWVCAGAPSSTAPAGMLPGDWILDTTNNDVYRYVSSTTYAKMNTST